MALALLFTTYGDILGIIIDYLPPGAFNAVARLNKFCNKLTNRVADQKKNVFTATVTFHGCNSKLRYSYLLARKGIIHGPFYYRIYFSQLSKNNRLILCNYDQGRIQGIYKCISYYAYHDRSVLIYTYTAMILQGRVLTSWMNFHRKPAVYNDPRILQCRSRGNDYVGNMLRRCYICYESAGPSAPVIKMEI